MELNGGSTSANHLCVLVHGLWGNPDHMNQVAKAVRAAYSEDQLYLLLAKRNSGNFTYDGIELGGERVCLEIEEEIESIRRRGGNITKLSIVGYSLGGLVARYAIGLLYAKGVLDEVEPVNFTTFATPHLGVRAPLRGWYDSVWNRLGARILSESGRQLFIVDKFRDTGRPLLSILTDPDSIFITGLKKFQRRTLYSNIVNDRTVVHYTSMITKTDPYEDLTKIKANHVKGYENVVLDKTNPVSPLPPHGPKSLLSSVATSGLSYVKNGPFVLALTIFLPLGITAFLLNSVVQTARSARRIQRHENGQAGIEIEKYRMPLWIKEIQGTVEDVYENLNNSQKQAYLTASEDGGFDSDLDPAEIDIADLEGQRSQTQPQSHLPTLALAPCQFDMITALDSVGWRKYPVWIHKVDEDVASATLGPGTTCPKDRLRRDAESQPRFQNLRKQQQSSRAYSNYAPRGPPHYHGVYGQPPKSRMSRFKDMAIGSVLTIAVYSAYALYRSRQVMRDVKKQMEIGLEIRKIEDHTDELLDEAEAHDDGSPEAAEKIRNIVMAQAMAIACVGKGEKEQDQLVKNLGPLLRFPKDHEQHNSEQIKDEDTLLLVQYLTADERGRQSGFWRRVTGKPQAPSYAFILAVNASIDDLGLRGRPGKMVSSTKLQEVFSRLEVTMDNMFKEGISPHAEVINIALILRDERRMLVYEDDTIFLV
ncbi:hypothetical protein NUW58_g8057 [Xylaria curta]|uniref:Uncharacterized protein n=1 Tax=Xylaria curta TaxID=42375 RepID=A0ACC1NB44_9PEZI|nr:hypothetical protein NUW58_g8057 [Xylaria curta]